MKKIYLLLISLTFAAVGYGQTIASHDFTEGTPTNPPAGWAASSVTFPVGYALFPQSPASSLTSPTYTVPSYASITVSFEAAKLANGSSVNLTAQYSLNNGTTWINGVIVSPGNNDTAFSGYNFTVNNPGTSFKVRFQKPNGNRPFGVRLLRIIGCATTANPQAFNAAPISASEINLGYTANAANNNTIIVFNTTNTFSAPTGTPPTVGSAFAGGTLLFNAPGNGTYNHTGLNPETIYYYRAYSYNGCSYSSGLSAQATTPCAAPSNQATNFTATNINSPAVGDATLNWTRGNGSNVLVVMRAGAAVTTDPSSGTAYTANSIFGNGAQIGTGNFVVYNGPASTVNVTGLAINTTYHVAIFEFNNTGNCYKIPALTGNFSVPGNVSYLFFSGIWFPADPNGIATAADNISVFLGNAIISINTLINNVTVSPQGALTVNAGTVLQVNGILNMESTNLNYSSLMVDGTVVGNIRYERHVNGGPDVGVGGPTGAGANDLISSPLVSSQDFGAFAASNPNIRFDERPLPDGDPNNKVFGPFDKATGTYLAWNSLDDAAEALVLGVGYRAASRDNTGFVFRGTVNQGNVTNDITFTTTPGVPFKPWNLVGNPYPAYINVGDFLNYVVYDDPDPDPALDIRNVDLLASSSAAIYGYDGDASDGWTIWNLNTPTRNITPGQGFLVAANSTQVVAYDLTFTPGMRRIGTTDDFIPGRLANPNNLHLKLRAIIGTGNHYTDFYFNDNSSSGLDRGYDAAVYGDVAASKSIYSRLVENSTGIDMAIQSLATSTLGSNIVVPLGIKAAQGQQVTVSIEESDLPSNIEVYLEDTVTSTFTLLNESNYIFTPSSTLNNIGRFFLRFSESTLSAPDSELNALQIYTTTAPRALLIKGQLVETTNVSIYDVQGRMVFSSQLEASSTRNQVDVSNLSSGVYVVKLNNSTQQKTQKVILK